MAFDAAVHKVTKEGRTHSEKDAKQPPTVEIELGGRKVQAQRQTVPTGAGSIPRFFSRLFG